MRSSVTSRITSIDNNRDAFFLTQHGLLQSTWTTCVAAFLLLRHQRMWGGDSGRSFPLQRFRQGIIQSSLQTFSVSIVQNPMFCMESFVSNFVESININIPSRNDGKKENDGCWRCRGLSAGCCHYSSCCHTQHEVKLITLTMAIRLQPCMCFRTL